VNTKDQENLLRQHMPEGFVEEYVTRDNAKVSDQFMPAANLFVVPGQRLFSMLYPGPKSGHTWGHIRGGYSYSCAASGGGWLWSVKYGELFTVERTDYNLPPPFHHVLCLSYDTIMTPILSDASYYSRQMARHCDPVPPQAAQDLGVRWVPVEEDLPTHRDGRRSKHVVDA
jgi:hypothetical protein